MQILSDYRYDTASLKNYKGSYEWWYFDGLTEDGECGFTIIFYEGNPFSRRYINKQQSSDPEEEVTAGCFPALSISVYQKGKPVYYGFCEHNPEEADFSSQRIYGRVGTSEFRMEKNGGRISYHVLLNQKLPNGDSIIGDLKFTSMNNDIRLSYKNLTVNNSKHTWNLVQPRADVSGKLKIDGFHPLKIIFKGDGYHDHNAGMEPMDDSFTDWYWGRFHLEGFTFIYYIMQRQDATQKNAWLIDKTGNAELFDKKCSLEYETLNLFGLKSSRKIIIEGEFASCLIQQDTILDNGPFYQRFRSRIIMNRGESILQGMGISEYIHPPRIKSRIFWPLVNMRITYPGEKHHWVLKSPRLYRWTW
jgi:carotenoid 1,2-hydratase